MKKGHKDTKLKKEKKGRKKGQLKTIQNKQIKNFSKIKRQKNFVLKYM